MEGYKFIKMRRLINQLERTMLHKQRNSGIIITILFVLSMVPVDGQNTAKQQFAKTFHADKTAAQSRYTEPENKRPFLFATPWTVPRWMNPFHNIGDSLGYMIGVSDPGLDSADAVKQAKLRAIALHLIMQKSKIKNLTDYYSNELENVNTEMYEYFSSAETLAKIPRYEVARLEFSNFNEAVVVLKFNSFAQTDPVWGEQLRIYTDLYKGEVQYFDRAEHNDHCRFTVLNVKGDTIMNYISTEYDKDYDVSSFMDGIEMKGFRYPFVYVTGGTDVSNLEKSYLTGGLWREFYKSTLNQMMALSQTVNSMIEKMGDRFANVNSFEKLTRTKSINTFTFKLYSFSFQPTYLEVEMKGIPVNP